MKRALLFLAGIATLLTGVALNAPASHALTISSPRDCDSNAVIRCGALDFNELQNRSSQAGAAEIFSSFGISMQDINNMPNTAVEGVVTKNNNVWIHRSTGLCPNINASSLSAQNQTAVQNNPNLCLVATNAMTAGRQNISGSTAASSGGVTFFKRPPSVSFVSSSLPAFVVMQNGQFRFAIIASCGNPVIATPVTPVAPVSPTLPKKTTTTTTTTTATTSTPTQTQSQSQNQNQSVTVNVPPAVQAATTTTTTTQPTTQSVATTKTLPNTGPGNILMLSGATSAIGTVGHWYYSRRGRRHH